MCHRKKKSCEKLLEYVEDSPFKKLFQKYFSYIPEKNAKPHIPRRKKPVCPKESSIVFKIPAKTLSPFLTVIFRQKFSKCLFYVYL